jgi:hypothetical protein
VSDERSWFHRFVEDFGKAPEEAPEPVIPQRLRVPVFLGMAVVSLVLLAVLLWLVVVPAIRSQGQRRPSSQAPAATRLARGAWKECS